VVAFDREACRDGSGVEDKQRAGLIELCYEIRGVELCDRDVAASRGADNRSICRRDDPRRFPGRRPRCYDDRDGACGLGCKRESDGRSAGQECEQAGDGEGTHGTSA
jgi:hypothetical protein